MDFFNSINLIQIQNILHTLKIVKLIKLYDSFVFTWENELQALVVTFVICVHFSFTCIIPILQLMDTGWSTEKLYNNFVYKDLNFENGKFRIPTWTVISIINNRSIIHWPLNEFATLWKRLSFTASVFVPNTY